MTEIWKDIPGYEGYYQVSSEGGLRSLDRTIYAKDRVMTKPGRFIIPHKKAKGYLGCQLHKNGVGKGMLIHRLVALAFLPNPDNKPQVNHINNIRDDNRLVNLEWVTPQENTDHQFSTGRLRVGPRPATHFVGGSRPVYQYKDGKLVGEYYSIREAAKHTGVSHCTIDGAIAGRHMLAAGSTWKYKPTIIGEKMPQYIREFKSRNNLINSLTNKAK